MMTDEEMTDEEMVKALEAEGYELDEGNQISGYFIPDGRKRIMIAGTWDVISEGKTLKEAFDGLPTPRGSVAW